MHGIGFGGLFMLGLVGAIVQIYRMADGAADLKTQTMLRSCLIIMCAAIWLIVLSGAYIVYPEYRVMISKGAVSDWQLANTRPNDWHEFALLWKEYAAWIAPIGITMLAYLVTKYGVRLFRFRGLRQAMLGFALGICVVIAAAVVGGYFLSSDSAERFGTSAHGMRTLERGTTN